MHPRDQHPTPYLVRVPIREWRITYQDVGCTLWFDPRTELPVLFRVPETIEDLSKSDREVHGVRLPTPAPAPRDPQFTQGSLFPSSEVVSEDEIRS